MLAIGYVTLFMALAMVAGSFLYGPLDTMLRTRKWVAFVGSAIGLAATVFLALNPVTTVTVTTVVFVVIGLAGSGYGLLMAHGRAFLPAHLMGRGITLLNFFAIGGPGVMQFATAGVVSASTVPDEPAAAYTALFWFYAAVHAAALVIYLSVRDARPEKSSRD